MAQIESLVTPYWYDKLLTPSINIVTILLEVEQTFEQAASLTSLYLELIIRVSCLGGGIGIRGRLRAYALWAWRFESSPRHKTSGFILAFFYGEASCELV